MRKSLKLEISVSEMLHYREQEGLTNKQIAERLGCSVATVYRFIGKRSYSVANAQAQNKPLPVPEAVATGRVESPIEEDEPIVEEPTMEVQKKPVVSAVSETPFSSFAPSLTVLKRREIIDFKGDYCTFEVDTGTESVNMKDGVIEGVMDKNGLFCFIRELMEIYKLFKQD